MQYKICEYCENKFYKKNKIYCSQVCMIEHMKMRSCQGCGEIKRKNSEHIEHYCSESCKEKHVKIMFKNSLSRILGLSMDMNLLEIEFKYECHLGVINTAIYDFYE